jgi:hypothetical protein
MKRYWPGIRAALLCFFVLGNLVQALPFPTKAIDADERDAWRRKDVDLWFGWLAGAGLIPKNRDAFQTRVVDGYDVLASVGAVVQAPTRPVFHMLRSTQQWGLFAVVGETPQRLVIDIEVDGEWKRLAARLDPEHTWHDDAFKYRRVRGTWDGVKPNKPAPLYEAFSRWAARDAFRDHPEATRVRVLRAQFVVAAPWETPDPTITVLDERPFTRKETLLWVLQ